MNLVKPAILVAFLGAVTTTSGCALFQPQETIDPVTGETVIVPAGPPSPSEPRDRGRGGGGGGSWG